MYTLYGFKRCGSVAVEIALELAAQPYRLVEAASWEPASAIDLLQQCNPLKQIPTLQLADGSVLTESAAILLHLGLSHPSSRLLPDNEAQRAQAIRGLVFIAANCYAAIGVIDYPERWCLNIDETIRAQIRQGAHQRLYHYWEIFADTYTPRPFLNGAEPGALDLLAAVASKWSGARAHLATARPAFLVLMEGIESHPRVAPVWQRHWPA